MQTNYMVCCHSQTCKICTYEAAKNKPTAESFAPAPCVPLKKGCPVWGRCTARPGSLGVPAPSQLASSRRREAPREPATSTSSCWPGPLFWFSCGSTSGSCSCCPFQWLVTHKHTEWQTLQPSNAALCLQCGGGCLCFSMGPEEGGGPLWSEELRWAEPRLMVGGAAEAGAWTRGGPVAWTNQRPASVHAPYRH